MWKNRLLHPSLRWFLTKLGNVQFPGRSLRSSLGGVGGLNVLKVRSSIALYISIYCCLKFHLIPLTSNHVFERKSNMAFIKFDYNIFWSTYNSCNRSMDITTVRIYVFFSFMLLLSSILRSMKYFFNTKIDIISFLSKGNTMNVWCVRMRIRSNTAVTWEKTTVETKLEKFNIL